jgi:hypothetical protein
MKREFIKEAEIYNAKEKVRRNQRSNEGKITAKWRNY